MKQQLVLPLAHRDAVFQRVLVMPGPGPGPHVTTSAEHMLSPGLRANPRSRLLFLVALLPAPLEVVPGAERQCR